MTGQRWRALNIATRTVQGAVLRARPGAATIISSPLLRARVRVARKEVYAAGLPAGFDGTPGPVPPNCGSQPRPQPGDEAVYQLNLSGVELAPGFVLRKPFDPI